jgi:hypothetical protein
VIGGDLLMILLTDLKCVVFSVLIFCASSSQAVAGGSVHVSLVWRSRSEFSSRH